MKKEKHKSNSGTSWHSRPGWFSLDSRNQDEFFKPAISIGVFSCTVAEPLEHLGEEWDFWWPIPVEPTADPEE